MNGRPLVGFPDVVRLKFKNGWVCSGVYLDRETILTAAHCLVIPESKKLIELEQVLTIGDSKLAVKEVKSIVHPSYEAQSWPAYDIAIIKTTENKNFEGSFHIETKQKISRGKATLFGCGKNDLSKRTYTRTMGENTFNRIGAVLFFMGESSRMDSNLGINVSIAPNDSGGPIIDQQTGNIIAVSTTTTVKNSAQYGILALSTGTSTVVSSNLNFISKYLKH
jgi:hypothetical protein